MIMKKIIIFSTLFFTCFNSFSQQVEKTDWLQKSKNQKTAAWILLGVGAGLDIAGIATTASNADKDLINTFGGKENVNHGAEYALYIAGTAALAGSLTLFIASKHNKIKAASISFKNEIVPQLQNSVVFNKPIPALSLKINF
jgi:hypothetical protein